jgi:hypothetical protein
MSSAYVGSGGDGMKICGKFSLDRFYFLNKVKEQGWEKGTSGEALHYHRAKPSQWSIPG